MNENSYRDTYALSGFAKQMMVLYYAMFASQAMLYIVVVLILPHRRIGMGIEESTLLLAVPSLNFIVVATGAVVYRIRVKAAAQAEALSQKIAAYRVGYILRMALLESLGAVNAFAYFLTGNSKFEILFILVLLLYVISCYPGEAKIRKEINMGIEFNR